MLVDVSKHKHWRIRAVANDRTEYEGNILATDKYNNMLLEETEMLCTVEGVTKYLGVVVLRGAYICYVELLSRPIGSVKSSVA